MKKINIRHILRAFLIFALSVTALSTGMIVSNKIREVNGSEVDRTFYYTDELENKSIVFYGDSITARHGLKSFHKDYMQILQEEFGFYYSNQAVGGATWSEVGPSTNNIFRQLNASKALYRDADCVSIFLGTNDFGLGRNIGSISDTTTSSIYGACVTALDTIIKANPDVKIMLITSLNRYDFEDSNLNDNGLTNSVGYTIEDVRNCIRTVSDEYNCSLVDLANLITEDNMSTLLNEDKLHVVEAGYLEIAKVIKSVQKN